MKIKPFVVCAAFSAVTMSAAVQAQMMVKVDGSSTVYPVTEAVAEDYQKSTQNKIRVTVGISGTGGGFKKFCRGEIDVSNASRPISKKEIADCKASGVQFIELPIAYDALTVVINPKNTWARTMTVAQLKTIWEPVAQGRPRATRQGRVYDPETSRNYKAYVRLLVSQKKGVARLAGPLSVKITAVFSIPKSKPKKFGCEVICL